MKKSKRGFETYPTGQKHHNARITDHEVELVRQLRRDGMSVRDVAAKMGISKGYVSRLSRNLCRA